VVVSDYDLTRAERTVGWIGDRHGAQVGDRFVAAAVDVSDPESVAAPAREHRITDVMNGAEFIGVLQTLHLLGLDSVTPLRVRAANGPVEVAPRDVVAAALPDPATLGPQMTGKTCAGLWVTGTHKGAPRQVYLYHVSDNEWTMAEYGCQCVVWQTAPQPGHRPGAPGSRTWSGAGVLGPEASTRCRIWI
jgi:saccharopine dehydrogenase-like NADP-dependent oxidoreductase